MAIVVIISAMFFITIKVVGQKAYFLAQFYMLTPTLAAIIVRAFIHPQRFEDAHLKFGQLKDYLVFWCTALGITLIIFIVYTLTGAVTWDFTGSAFLKQLEQYIVSTGKTMEESLPKGVTPTMMLLTYFFGGLTVLNIFPGVITGFAEEFGWRGLMFPELYKISPFAGFIIGGLIWFLWNAPMALIIPMPAELKLWETTGNIIVLGIGSVCTFIFLAYVYIKTRNIWVVSITHMTLNNSSHAFMYYCVMKNQLLANTMLSLTMAGIVLVLYFTGEHKVFEEYFGKHGESLSKFGLK
ncbi:MAG: CPBP family intramembrane glutamic endopeptidase [Elusimicrobiota bacterium]